MRKFIFDNNTEDDWVQVGEIVEIMKHGSPVVAIAVRREHVFDCKRCVFLDTAYKNGVYCKAPDSKDKSHGNCKVCFQHTVCFVPIDKTLENL